MLTTNHLTVVEDLFSLSTEDSNIICGLQVPVPENEADRIKVLRQSNLLDSDRDDGVFDRFTALAQRLFKVGE